MQIFSTLIRIGIKLHTSDRETSAPFLNSIRGTKCYRSKRTIIFLMKTKRLLGSWCFVAAPTSTEPTLFIQLHATIADELEVAH